MTSLEIRYNPIQRTSIVYTTGLEINSAYNHKIMTNNIDFTPEMGKCVFRLVKYVLNAAGYLYKQFILKTSNSILYCSYRVTPIHLPHIFQNKDNHTKMHLGTIFITDLPDQSSMLTILNCILYEMPRQKYHILKVSFNLSLHYKFVKGKRAVWFWLEQPRDIFNIFISAGMYKENKNQLRLHMV